MMTPPVPHHLYVFKLKQADDLFEGEYLHAIHGVSVWQPLCFRGALDFCPRFVKLDDIEWCEHVMAKVPNMVGADYALALTKLTT